jgi:hypothetical protein
MTSSYRESERPIRYICIVCYQTVATVDGSCGDCGGSPLQLIEGNEEIIAELRQRAKAKKERPGKRQFAFVSIAALVLSIGLHAVLIGLRVYDLDRRRDVGWTGRYGAGGTLFFLLFFTFLAFVIILTYGTHWLGLFHQPADAANLNPDTADIASLLRWLGLGFEKR